MTVIYETNKPRYIVQECESHDIWTDLQGFSDAKFAGEEADILQRTFPTNRYRVIDTREETK